MRQEERTVSFDKDLDLEALHFKGIRQEFPNHFHEHYVISFIENGKRRLSCKKQKYIVGSGDLLLFNPMDNHACEQIDDQPFDYKEIYIKPEVMQKVMLEVTGKVYLPNFSRCVGFHSEQISLLRELHQAVMEKRSGFYKEEMFLLLIEQVAKKYIQPFTQVKPEENNTKVEVICEYIESHYPKRLSLDDLSQLAEMNKYSLLRAFTKAKGITPYRYLEMVRINEATRLLKSGVGPMDAALQTGFADQSHLTNYFKLYIGLTPKQYQNIFACANK